MKYLQWFSINRPSDVYTSWPIVWYHQIGSSVIKLELGQSTCMKYLSRSKYKDWCTFMQWKLTLNNIHFDVAYFTTTKWLCAKLLDVRQSFCKINCGVTSTKVRIFWLLLLLLLMFCQYNIKRNDYKTSLKNWVPRSNSLDLNSTFVEHNLILTLIRKIQIVQSIWYLLCSLEHIF